MAYHIVTIIIIIIIISISFIISIITTVDITSFRGLWKRRAAPGPPVSPGFLKGWQNTVGNLIELFVCSEKPITASFCWHMRETQGNCFIEFEIPNSTISTVFRQPLSFIPLSESRSALDLQCSTATNGVVMSYAETRAMVLSVRCIITKLLLAYIVACGECLWVLSRSAIERIRVVT